MFRYMDHGERQIFVELSNSIRNLLSHIISFVVNEFQCHLCRNFFFGVIQSNALSIGTVRIDLQDIGSFSRQNKSLPQRMLMKVKVKHRKEVEVNEKYRIFLMNSRRLLEGPNSAQGQLHNVKHSRVYSKIGTLEELPLGEEFQELCQAFINVSETDEKKRYKKLSILVSQLKLSLSMKVTVTLAQNAQEKLNISCCQILRAVIFNEILRLPDDWETNIADPIIIRQLRHIRAIQNAVNDMNLWPSIVPHMAQSTSKTCKNLWALIKILLFNSSKHVQETMLQYFKTTTVEAFFFSMNDLLGLMKKELSETERTSLDVVRKSRQHKRATVRIHDNISELNLEYLEESLNTFAVFRRQKQLFGEVHKPQFFSVLSDDSGMLLVDVLAGMCDGQYQPLQDYLREQDDNAKSFNIISILCSIISLVYSSFTSKNCQYLTKLFVTLKITCVGNYWNRVEVLNGKIIDVTNYVLRCPAFPECDPMGVLQLRESIASLLIALIEESRGDNIELAKEVMWASDKQSLFRVMTLYYQLAKADVIPNLKELVTWSLPQETDSNFWNQFVCWRKLKLHQMKQIKEYIYEVGFEHYTVLARFMDLNPDFLANNKEIIQEQHLIAFRGFSKGGRSVEIVREGVIQKMHFRVKNPEYLRNAVREEMKWRVDRSSAANKLRDFLVWADTVMDDIHHSRRIIRSRLFKLISTLWPLWNGIPVLLSTAIAVLALISFQARTFVKNSVNESVVELNRPDTELNSEYESFRPALLYLAISHNIFSIILLVAFISTYHPGWDNLKHVWSQWKTLWHKTPIPGMLAKRKQKVRIAKELRHFQILIEATLPIGHSVSPEVLQDKENSLKEEYNQLEVNSDEEKENTVYLDEFDRNLLPSRLALNVVSFTTLYYLAFILLSLTGTILGQVNPGGYFFFAFHLINIFSSNQDLEGVLKALKGTVIPILWVLVLLVVILYMFALIVFLFYRMSMNNDNGMWADTLWHSFVTLIHSGLIFNLWQENFAPYFLQNQNFRDYHLLSLVSISLYVLVPVLTLSIISGIIVDKFAELRSEKNNTKKDMEECCYICNRSNYEFETQGKGFYAHVQSEHNMWSYMHLMIFIHQTNLSKLTALQLYVYHLQREKRGDFFPIMEALSLQKADEDKDAQKMKQVMENIQLLVAESNMKKLDRETAEEQWKQGEWVRSITSKRKLLMPIIQKMRGRSMVLALRDDYEKPLLSPVVEDPLEGLL